MNTLEKQIVKEKEFQTTLTQTFEDEDIEQLINTSDNYWKSCKNKLGDLNKLVKY